MKRLLSVLVALALVLTLVGCAPSSSDKAVAKMKKAGYLATASTYSEVQDDGAVAVVTGSKDSLSELLSSAGAKRVIPLAVSGAFHSKMMKNASDEFANGLDEFKINDAKIPVVTNIDAEITTKDFKEKMIKQIYSSVYWTQSVQKMIENGADTFVEIGNGRVLAGLIKKINSDVKIYNVKIF